MNSDNIKVDVADRAKHKAAKIAGVMFLCSVLIPLLNWILVLSQFIVPENAVSTAHNILANRLFFRIGILNEVLIALVIVILSLALYEILKTVNTSLALCALILKVIDAFLTLVIALGHVIALQILSNVSSLSPLNQEPVKALVGLFLNIHISLTSIPGMFLGLSMSIFLYLLFKSRYIPGILAGFGFISYVLLFMYDVLFFLFPTFSFIPLVQILGWGPNVLFLSIVGVWLLYKGIRIQKV